MSATRCCYASSSRTVAGEFFCQCYTQADEQGPELDIWDTTLSAEGCEAALDACVGLDAMD